MCHVTTAMIGRSSTDSAVFSAERSLSRLNASRFCHCVAATSTATAAAAPTSGNRQLHGSANPTASPTASIPPIHTLRVSVQ